MYNVSSAHKQHITNSHSAVKQIDVLGIFDF